MTHLNHYAADVHRHDLLRQSAFRPIRGRRRSVVRSLVERFAHHRDAQPRRTPIIDCREPVVAGWRKDGS